jgi:hypothetical protein
MKTISIMFALFAIALFVAGCGKDDSSSSSSDSGSPSGSSPSPSGGTQPTGGIGAPPLGGHALGGQTPAGGGAPPLGGGHQPATTPHDGTTGASPYATPGHPEGGTTEPPANTGNEFTAYKYEKAGIEIKYPTGWKAAPEQDPDGAMSLAFTPPDNSDGPAKMFVAVTPAGDKSLDQYADIIKDQLKQAYPDFASANDQHVTVNGLACTIFEANYTDAGNVKKHGIAFVTTKDGAGYVVGYNNTPDKFDALKKTHNTVARSLNIVAKPQFAAAQTELKIEALERKTFEAYGVALKLPKNWKTEQAQGYVVTSSDPAAQGAQARVLISTEPANDRTFDKVMEDGKRDLKANVPGYEEVSSNTTVKAGNLTGRIVVYNQPSQELKFRVEAAVFMDGKHVYYVFCSYLLDEFNKVSPTFDEILKSFEVTAPAGGNNGGGGDGGDEWGEEGGGTEGGAEGLPVQVGELTRQEFAGLIALNLPKDWTAAEVPGRIDINSKPDAKGHVAQVMLSAEETAGRALDKVTADAKASLKANVTGYKEISTANITVGNLKGKVVVYEQDTEKSGVYRVSVAIFVTDKYSYYIFCAYSADAYDKMAPTFKQIQESFEVLPEQPADGGDDGGGGDDWSP